MEFVELEEPFGRQRCQNFVVADAVVAAVVPRLRLSGLPSAVKKQNTVPSTSFLVAHPVAYFNTRKDMQPSRSRGAE